MEVDVDPPPLRVPNVDRAARLERAVRQADRLVGGVVVGELDRVELAVDLGGDGARDDHQVQVDDRDRDAGDRHRHAAAAVGEPARGRAVPREAAVEVGADELGAAVVGHAGEPLRLALEVELVARGVGHRDHARHEVAVEHEVDVGVVDVRVVREVAAERRAVGRGAVALPVHVPEPVARGRGAGGGAALRVGREVRVERGARVEGQDLEDGGVDGAAQRVEVDVAAGGVGALVVPGRGLERVGGLGRLGGRRGGPGVDRLLLGSAAGQGQHPEAHGGSPCSVRPLDPRPQQSRNPIV